MKKELLVVAPGFTFHWPEEVGGGVRGGGGLVIPRDDPLAQRQLDKCMGAPAEARVTPHDNVLAARFYAAAGYTDVPFDEFGPTPEPVRPAPRQPARSDDDTPAAKKSKGGE